MALNESEINELSDEEYELKIAKSYETLANAGAHYVIDSIAELPPVIEDINRRLAAGERPWAIISDDIFDIFDHRILVQNLYLILHIVL